MILRPDRLRDFAQRSRDVVVASAVVGVVTGLVVAGADRVTTDLLDWVRHWPDWLGVVGPGVGLVLTSLVVFTAVYAVLAVIWFWLLRRYVVEGPLEHDSEPAPPTPPGDDVIAPLSFAY